MNERQYACLRQNKRFRGARGLGEPPGRDPKTVSPAAAIFAHAARAARQRSKVAVAWAQIAMPSWQADSEVTAVENDAVVITVRSATLHFELRRHQAALERELARLAPGTARLRFVFADDPGRSGTTTG